MLRKERHSISDLKVHLVCVTKDRKRVFTAEGLELIKNSFETVAKKMNFKILEFNGEDDHVHTAIEYPPKLSISQIQFSGRSYKVHNQTFRSTVS